VHFVHGGYWRDGDRRYYSPVVGLYGNVGLALAKRGIGATVQSYRLPPEVDIEGELEDVARAVRFVQENAAVWGADPERVILAGHSSGGHLVTLLSCDRSYLKAVGADPRRVRGVIALSPVLDLVNMRERGDALFNATVTVPVFGAEPARLRRFSPSTRCGKSMPPLLILLAERDYPYLSEQVPVQTKRLADLGAPVELQIVPGYTHEDMVLEINAGEDRITPAIAAFVARTKGKPS
jgi:acetyl esterase/lipase